MQTPVQVEKLQQEALDHPYEAPPKRLVEERHVHDLVPKARVLLTVYVTDSTGWWHVSMSVEGKQAMRLDEKTSKETERLLHYLLSGVGKKDQNKIMKGVSYQLIRPLTAKEHEYALDQIRKEKLH